MVDKPLPPIHLTYEEYLDYIKMKHPKNSTINKWTSELSRHFLSFFETRSLHVAMAFLELTICRPASFHLRDPSALASQVLGLNECATIPRKQTILKKYKRPINRITQQPQLRGKCKEVHLLLAVKIGIIKKRKSNKLQMLSRLYGKQEPLIHCCWEGKLVQPLQKHEVIQQTKLGFAIPLLSYIPEGIKSKHKGDLHTRI